jgi:hypothetical protein
MVRPSESYNTTSARERRSSVEIGRLSNVGLSPVPIICTIEEEEEGWLVEYEFDVEELSE